MILNLYSNTCTHMLLIFNKNLLSFTLCGLYLEKKKYIGNAFSNYGQSGWDAHIVFKLWTIWLRCSYSFVVYKQSALEWDEGVRHIAYGGDKTKKDSIDLQGPLLCGIWESMEGFWAWSQRHVIWPNLNLNKRTRAAVWRMDQRPEKLESGKLSRNSYLNKWWVGTDLG